VVGRAAGFHHHKPHPLVGEPVLELAVRQVRALGNLPVSIGHHQCEGVFARSTSATGAAVVVFMSGLLPLCADTHTI
jgi:hypothetical protein